MKHYFFIALYALLLLASAIPPFDAADVVHPQWLYLGLFTIITIGITYSYVDLDGIINPLKSKYVKLFGVFSLICLLSIIFSENKAESLLVFSRVLNIFFLLYISNVLLSKIEKPFTTVTYMVVSLLIYELYLIYDVFFEIQTYTKYDFSYASLLKGNTGNKNIASASIMCKIPFVIYLLHSIKNDLIKLLLYVLMIISVYAIIVIGSRATLLSGSALIIILLIYYFTEKKSVVNKIKKASLLLSSLAFAIIISKFTIWESSSLENRVDTIANYSEDYSAQSRLRYYSHGLEHLINNPIIGCGIGNWKLKSIFYDKEGMSNYIVPYNLHNDFLEVGTETGLIGMLIYLSMFVLFFKQTLFEALIKRNLEYGFVLICLGGSMVIYFIDANLNFPMQRVIMTVHFVVLFSMIEHFKKNLNPI